ncbi:MAG: hypothetical protein ACE5K1_00145 [Acidiferrobacterales bacterium]
MNYYFLVAALLVFVLGLAHSVLGERLVLGPLTRRHDLPPLLGSIDFMEGTLRFTWHVTTVLLWSVSATLVSLALLPGVPVVSTLAWIIAAALFVCAVIAGVTSRGRHFSWYVFLGSAVLVWLGRH